MGLQTHDTVVSEGINPIILAQYTPSDFSRELPNPFLDDEDLTTDYYSGNTVRMTQLLGHSSDRYEESDISDLVQGRPIEMVMVDQIEQMYSELREPGKPIKQVLGFYCGKENSEKKYALMQYSGDENLVDPDDAVELIELALKDINPNITQGENLGGAHNVISFNDGDQPLYVLKEIDNKKTINGKTEFEREYEFAQMTGDTKSYIGSTFLEVKTASGSKYFILTDYEIGDNLEAHFAQNSFEENIETMLEVLDRLQEYHEKGIVHRDLKPANVLKGSNDEVKLIDMGISGIVGDSYEGKIIGTPSHLPPEAIVSKEGTTINLTLDTYAATTMLYQAATGGFTPLNRTGMSTIKDMIKAYAMSKNPGEHLKRLKFRQAINRLNPVDAEEFEKILMKGWSVNPKERYQNAREMKEALETFSVQLSMVEE